MRWIAGVACAAALTACETRSGAGGFSDVLGGFGLGGVEATDQLAVAEIEAGLRQALEIGTERVAGQLGAMDGFFGDPRVRIPLPGQLADAQSQLRRVGLSGPLDDLQIRMNRAAEAAMPEARTLVVDAVRSMTLQDALGILNGGDTAATDFLKTRTETRLRSAFSPPIEAALAEIGAFQSLESVAVQNGLGGVVGDLRADFVGQTVQYGLDGVFLYLAEEEASIREDPAARTTELLRRVFGAADA